MLPPKPLRCGTYPLKGLVFDEDELLGCIDDYLCDNNLPLLYDLNKIGGPYVSIEQGKFQGRINKRLKKYLTEKRVEIPPKFSSEVGEIVSKLTNKSIVMKITKNLEWEQGEYGDDGSCFWEGRSVCRTEIFPAWDVHACLIESNDGQGMARCWIYPIHAGDELRPITEAIKVKRDLLYIAFNPYGYEVDRFTRILSYQFNWVGHLLSQFEGDGAMYVNSGESVLFNGPEINRVFTSMGGEASRCENCDTYSTELNDGGLCDDCYHPATCFGCGDQFHEKNMYGVGLEQFCHDCFYEWKVCDDCGELVKMKGRSCPSCVRVR